jgi:hypothetical protein
MVIATTHARGQPRLSDAALKNKEAVTMRPATLIAVAGLVSVVLFLSAGIALGQPSALQRVEDREGRFVISLPMTWRVEQSRRDLPALSALSPEPPEAPPDSVEVFVRDMSLPLSPQACAQQVTIAMRMTIHEWTTLSEGPDAIGGLAAYSRVYTWHQKDGAERRSLQTCVPLGRRVFVIIGTTINSPSHVAQNLPELARIIVTFRPGSAPLPPDPEPRGGGNH